MNRDIRALDKALECLFQEKGFPGIAVTIRGPEGVLFEKGYGMRDIENQLPADENTIFGIASMMSGIDESFDAAMYIGYHSPAFTNTSPLAHTTNFSRYNYIKINDHIASEFTINSLWADMCHVPSIYLSGDEGICTRATEEYPDIVTTAVKKGIGAGTWNLHPAAAIRQIKADVTQALSHPHPLRQMNEHYVLEIQYKSHMDACNASWYPGVTQLDAHTIRFESNHFYDVRVAMSFIG